MAQHWLTRFVLAGYWFNTYAKHRPRRNELADNFLDDNCNGLIDETEILYREHGLSSASGQIMLHVRVNDKKIRQNANVIVAHVFDLADIECSVTSQEVTGHPAIQTLQVGELSYTLTGSSEVHMIGPSVLQDYFWYLGDQEFMVEINGLPQGTGAYAVALTYHRLKITDWDPIEVDFWQLKCIGPDGTITSDTTCAKAGRIASNVYFTVTGRSSIAEEKLRKLVANRALHEWWLSEYHSSVFLWNSGVDGNWKIGGNEDRRVKLKCSDNYRIKHEHWVYKALGHIGEMQPIVNGN